MGRELTKANQELVSTIGRTDLGDIIKPLIREIHLFDSYIAHSALVKGEGSQKKLNIGDNLTLQREDNRFNSESVLILDKEGHKLGYIPEKDTIVFARLLDAGKMLKAKVQRIENKSGFPIVGIGIFLVDL